MPRFKVCSGGFEIVVQENSFNDAADIAIQIHNESNSTTELNELTMMENLETGEIAYIGTRFLIDNHTAGFGKSTGQYSKIDQEPKITKFKKE